MSVRSKVVLVCVTLLVALQLIGGGCGKQPARLTTIKLATTTSTENSGLLDALLPVFREKHSIEVQVIAVGTGKAIKHGENGDVDVILVHARSAEDKFVADGYGANRRDVMHNDFVILGPAEDPAGVRGMKDAAAALTRLADSKVSFVSRGDDSGTHKKEHSLWHGAGIEPSGSWYLSAGQGMGACLTMANEKRAYVLSDRGTYLAYGEKINLEVLVEGDGPRPLETDTVVIECSKMYLDGRVFESSFNFGHPYIMRVRAAIAGLHEALLLMREGSKYRLYIPHDLAYGPVGSGWVVGPYATLIYEVELLEIQ